MPALPRPTFLPLACLALLGACGSGDEAPKEPGAEADPALTGALGDQIMVDPDLAGQNEAGASGAIASQSGALPPDDNSPKAIAAAQADALALLGGAANLRQAPAARELVASASTGAILTAAARASSSPAGGPGCAGQVSYTMSWAAKLPEGFPVYPRGNVQEAAGTDNPGCALRIVTFTTPVALGQVVNFYYSRAIGAGFRPDYVRQGGDDVLGGSKGGASFMIYARTLPTGRTEVDLVTSG